ncbi:MAG: hypothetical protein R3E87_02725 [Burkholderiaceae bacterium]
MHRNDHRSDPRIALGQFDLGDGRTVHGELTFDGDDTRLRLTDSSLIVLDEQKHRTIRGTLTDLTQVILLNCIAIENLGSRSRGHAHSYFASVYPHFVLEGSHQLDPDQASISAIYFDVDDAATIFYDYSAFGSAHEPERYIDQLVRQPDGVKTPRTGDEPREVYFAGRRQIVSVTFNGGTVSASHNPAWNLGGPNGISIHNRISNSITLSELSTFDHAIGLAIRLGRFLGLVAGRPQNISNVQVSTSEESPDGWYKVYWCNPPGRKLIGKSKDRLPHPADLPLDAVEKQDEFVTVLRGWLNSDAERLRARVNFLNSFAYEHHYSVERLVGAANAFDLLPDSALPRQFPVDPAVLSARDQCRAIFKALPDSPDRNSVLGALGRVGGPSLKQKVRHRASRIAAQRPDLFPHLLAVLDLAIDCRNYYVHGTETKVDFDSNFDTVVFLTDALEFIFFASEFMDFGWNLSAFLNKGTTQSHKFSSFRIQYAYGIANLRNLSALPNS